LRFILNPENFPHVGPNCQPHYWPTLSPDWWNGAMAPIFAVAAYRSLGVFILTDCRPPGVVLTYHHLPDITIVATFMEQRRHCHRVHGSMLESGERPFLLPPHHLLLRQLSSNSPLLLPTRRRSQLHHRRYRRAVAMPLPQSSRPPVLATTLSLR
jgi:hypothetical protein